MGYPGFGQNQPAQPTQVIKFHPTATAVLANETNEAEVRSMMEQQTGTQYTDQIWPNWYYLAFLGNVYAMSERQFAAARGLV